MIPVRERTLSIIKPDATRRDLIGAIVSRLEAKGLKPIAMEMKNLSRSEAEGFYAVHREKPFYGDLVEYMISGPVVVMALEGEDAIRMNREIMGATNPKNAAPGTIRKEYALSVQENSVHGSDSPETAKWEIAYFFPALCG
jgi:nucleoside-diphosphate kinase